MLNTIKSKLIDSIFFYFISGISVALKKDVKQAKLAFEELVKVVIVSRNS